VKCPFRKVTEYLKKEKINPLLKLIPAWEPCTRERAEKIICDFADCYEADCPGFKKGKCECLNLMIRAYKEEPSNG